MKSPAFITILWEALWEVSSADQTTETNTVADLGEGPRGTRPPPHLFWVKKNKKEGRKKNRQGKQK